MSDNKYYIPELHELHYDFECELSVTTATSPSDTETHWEKITIGDGSKYDQLLRGNLLRRKSFEIEACRVKYLDRKDIESFSIGDIKFRYDNNAEPIPSRKDSLEMPIAYMLDDQLVTGQLWILYHYEKDNIIWIEYIKDCGGEGFLFKGYCKNKSQLKQILQWTGIIQGS